MSMMMPPEAPPMEPGGGLPPELMAALGGAPPMDGPEMPMGAEMGPTLMSGPGAGMGEDEMMPSDEEMSTVDHIRQAIEHLKQAFDLDDDDARGAQTIGSLASLQKILGGEQQKDQKLSQALGA